jgi:chitin disaccharide deacetylase
MKQIKLIVNADDFGQSPGVNRGIILAHEKGIVTSASLMVRYAAAKEASLYAKNNSSLGIGLHVDLGEWIYRNNDWEPLYEVVLLDDAEEVKKEVYRQLELFYQLMGRKPTHIDTHQHTHLRKNISPIFIEIAQNLNITLRRCSAVVKYCGDFYGQCADGSPYHQAITVEGLKQILSRLPEGYTEMACHPALGDDIETMYRTERGKEVETLCDNQIKTLITKQNIELCSFKDIAFGV